MNRWGMSFGLLFLLLGCRHSAPPTARGPEGARMMAGDPSTNVMTVPMSAGWVARGGGTNRLPTGIVSARPFPFPDYDQSLVKSVYGRWQALLKAEPQPAAQGAVVVEFVLHADGSVSRLRKLPSEVTPRLEDLCERAIMELTPFPKWPPEMGAEIGADSRSIRISFDFKTASSGQ